MYSSSSFVFVDIFLIIFSENLKYLYVYLCVIFVVRLTGASVPMANTYAHTFVHIYVKRTQLIRVVVSGWRTRTTTK